MSPTRSRRSTDRRRGLLTALVTVVLAFTTVPPAVAADGDVGYSGSTYGPPAGGGWVDPDKSPTATKPQSKLWFAQDRWWGVMLDRASGAFRIHSLDRASQTWTDTGVLVDGRSGSRADVLWDGEHLWTASAPGSGSGTANGIQISRYRPVDGGYARDPGFPVTVSSGGVEAAVIARDTTGRLWVTFTQSTKVRVVTSGPDGSSWGAPFSPPVSGTTVTKDDISTVASYDGKVSVVWSNQNDDSIYAATHVDGRPVTTWDASRRPVSGPREADDHINLKGVEGDAAGRLFVAVKTSLNDVKGNSSAPLVYVLVLGTDDAWRRYTAWRVGDGVTRPILLIDRTNRKLRVFAAGPETGGVVYMKETPLDSVSFEAGTGEPFIRLASDKNVNNPTSTKQPVTATSGLVVLASDQVTGRYVHNTMPLGSEPPPPPPDDPPPPDPPPPDDPPDDPPSTGDYADAVLADSPVGYWRLGGTGTTVAAEAGPPGSVVGTVTPADGVLVDDGARAFDGVTGYVSVPSEPSLNPTGDLTVEGWARPARVDSGVVLQKGGSWGYPVWQYRLGMTSGGQWRGTVFVGSTAYAVTAPGSARIDTWTHLALTRRDGTLAIYVDGSLAATAPGPGTLNTTTSMLAIGRSGASSTSYFDGMLDEVAVYDHALSAEAIADRHAHGSG